MVGQHDAGPKLKPFHPTRDSDPKSKSILWHLLVHDVVLMFLDKMICPAPDLATLPFDMLGRDEKPVSTWPI